ncbi:unnamed protein product [Kuraishia capsulata CBS 1993]|uniref:Ribosomal lysine N-methyltransferase 5 n=1 Tax=Kuraishia capsulata CBS 1993 TaxID=1382522 RepID=W6MP13_9ASCO|nr:uncharacterized protein KUCA_T00004396001 [Kuraishia capsulata CBS 1993]CDK28414.1 unnamed protein product [Kuraishia capsulata CBS 1993]
METLDVSGLDLVTEEEIADHVYELYTQSAPPNQRGLGYLERSDLIHVTVNDHDLQIHQSVSSLSGKESSSTGFVAWSSSVPFAQWLPGWLGPSLKELQIVELGAGVSGILSATIGPKCSRYLATDQKHILKLLKKNLEENLSQEVHSTTLDASLPRNTRRTDIKNYPKIDIAEYDWEYSDSMKNDILAFFPGGAPDLILASDTIYNEYLIKPFADAIEGLSGNHTGFLGILQLRDESIIEAFLVEMTNRAFQCYHIPGHLVSDELSHGYVLYYMRKAVVPSF